MTIRTTEWIAVIDKDGRRHELSPGEYQLTYRVAANAHAIHGTELIIPDATLQECRTNGTAEVKG
jgi:hypothetical protein